MMCQLVDASAGSEDLWVSKCCVSGSDWESCMVVAMHHHCSILLEVFTCDPVQVEDVHTHMQHITSNSTGERAKLWRKLRVGHTSKVSTYLLF